MLLWLADVLRDAGLTVHEEPGWRTREVPGTSYGPVRGVIIHETRGSATSSDAGEIGVLINGRVGLSGPIAQLYLSRDGDWHVIAAGTCHHVKTGWGGPHAGYGNDSLLGIEAQHAASESWSDKPAQYRSYVRGVAAILRHTGWPVSRVAGHKEHQPGDKSDPEFSMDRFRADVAAAMEEDDEMAGVAEQILATVERIDRRGPDWHLQDQGDRPRSDGAVFGWRQVRALLESILAAVQGADATVILDRIDQLAADVEAGQQQLAQVLTEQVAPALVADLAEQLDGVTAEQLTEAVEAGIRRVAASIAAPPGQG